MISKVLIVFESMHQITGGGITLTNLFSSFEKKELINSCLDTQYIDEKSVLSVCSFYRVGNLEKKYCFPMNFYYSNSESAILGVKDIFFLKDQMQVSDRNISLCKSFLRKLVGWINLDFFSYKLCVSDQYIEWVKNNKPDVIYAQVYNAQTIEFVLELKKKTNLPLVLHMMDDWVSSYKSNPLVFKRVSRKLKDLIAASNLLLTISDSMKKEYVKRYNKDSIVFHNTLSLSNWLPYSKTDYSIAEKVKILYAGRIGLGTFYSFLLIIEAVEIFNCKSKCKIELHIQTPTIEKQYKEKLLSYKSVSFNKVVNYEDLPKVYSAYDILVLPIDYQKKGAAFLKYSMPTKVPEYSISGIPILVCAPVSSALFEDARLNKWAYVIENRGANVGDIVRALEQLVASEDLRKSLGESAKSHALNYYSSDIVCDKFRRSILSVLNS